MSRGDLTDSEWGAIGERLPSERGRKTHLAYDSRRFLPACGMFYA